jgi:hypothetical protein
VTVTKYDIWKDLLPFPHALPLKRVADHPVAALDIDRVMIVSFALRRLLADLCPEVVATAEAMSSNVTYIPVSALGHSPTEDPRAETSSALVVRPKDIRPRWATVPMLSMLAALGLLPSTRTKRRGDLPVPSDCRIYGERMVFTVPGTEQRLEAPRAYFGRPMRCPVTGVELWIPSAGELQSDEDEDGEEA